MPPHLTPARFVTCAVMAASALAAGCSSNTDQMRVALATPVKVEATGELRLYGADGRQTRVLNQASLAGSVLARSQSRTLDPDQPGTDNDWFNVALTPDGLAVFTDRRGNYQFVALGQSFDSAPVMDGAQDDADGARPGLVYAAR